MNPHKRTRKATELENAAREAWSEGQEELGEVEFRATVRSICLKKLKLTLGFRGRITAYF